MLRLRVSVRHLAHILLRMLHGGVLNIFRVHLALVGSLGVLNHTLSADPVLQSFLMDSLTLFNLERVLPVEILLDGQRLKHFSRDKPLLVVRLAFTMIVYRALLIRSEHLMAHGTVLHHWNRHNHFLAARTNTVIGYLVYRSVVNWLRATLVYLRGLTVAW